VVVGWLTRVTLTLAVIGVILFDTASLLVGRVSVSDHADAAAQAARDAWRPQHSYAAAVTAAQGAADNDELVANSLVIGADGTTTLALHRNVSTLILQHIPRAKRLGDVTEVGLARPPLN
jgi:hypothetical protein